MKDQQRLFLRFSISFIGVLAIAPGVILAGYHRTLAVSEKKVHEQLASQLRNSVARLESRFTEVVDKANTLSLNATTTDPADSLPSLFFTVDELDEIQDIKATIIGYVEETIAWFATGDMDIENDWDDYLDELNDMGLDKLIEVTQTVYTRQYGK